MNGRRSPALRCIVLLTVMVSTLSRGAYADTVPALWAADPQQCYASPCYTWWTNAEQMTTAGSALESCAEWAPIYRERYIAWSGHTVSVVGVEMSSPTQGLCRLIDNQSGGMSLWQLGTKAIRTPDPAGYSCPANATYNGGTSGTCACNAGFIRDPASPAQCIEAPTFDSTQTALACPASGNPIYPLTGGKRDAIRTGFLLGGNEFSLTYDSTGKTAASQTSSSNSMVEGSFGELWWSSLHRKLVVSRDKTRALLARGDGLVLNFTGNGSGSFTASGRIPYQLVPTSGGYRFADAQTGSLETYDLSGNVLTVSSPNGSTLSFYYTGGKLTRVTNVDGRAITFLYRNGLVSVIVGPDARRIHLTYDTHRNLTSVTWPDGKMLGLLYERTDLPWALTGKVDENNARFATFGYDADGRAISTEYAGGVNSFSVSYASGPMRLVTDDRVAGTNTLRRTLTWQIPAGVTVTQPNGALVGLDSQLVAGIPSLISQSQPAGSGCGPAASNVVYDSNGNVSSLNAFDGTRSCFVYDNVRREIARIEGLPGAYSCASAVANGAVLPQGARKIETTWHPDWHFPKQTLQPLLRTTYVYQGQPDPFNGNAAANCTSAGLRSDGKPVPLLCKKVEEPLLPTGVADGAPRTETLTYDAAGRILTKVDALNRTTTYAYYADTSFSGGAFDPHYEKVSLLLRGNGATGDRLVVDESVRQKSVEVRGGAQITTAESKLGGGAVSFDGSRDFLLIPYSTDFAFGSEDFTIEAFVYKKANNTNGSRLWNPNGDVYDGVALYIDPSGNFGAYVSTSGTSWSHYVPAIANLANAQWYHLAVVRSGGSVFAFVNGIRYTVTSGLGAAVLYSNTTLPRVIGGQNAADRALNGYIDEFRITKGVARYTADFMPPTQEFLSGPDTQAIGHTAGDLQRVTNAAGHVMQSDSYDPAGRLRQMTDTKGAVTSTTYTPRGSVSTVSVTPPSGAGRTTTYTYDNVGQLTGMSMPDGTSITYSYDAAHRLMRATDSRGNSVTYTLDNEGKRVAEEVRDPTGSLQRSIGRSFDALGRLQQVIGAQQ